MADGNPDAAATPSPAVPFKYWFWGEVFGLLRVNGRTFLICGTIVLCCYYMAEALRAYAGQITFASLTLRILVNVVLKWVVTVVASGISIALYLRERRQHEDTPGAAH